MSTGKIEEMYVENEAVGRAVQRAFDGRRDAFNVGARRSDLPISPGCSFRETPEILWADLARS